MDYIDVTALMNQKLIVAIFVKPVVWGVATGSYQTKL